MSKNVKGVNNVDFRRKWDKEDFAEKAKEREEKVLAGAVWAALALPEPGALPSARSRLSVPAWV